MLIRFLCVLAVLLMAAPAQALRSVNFTGELFQRIHPFPEFDTDVPGNERSGGGLLLAHDTQNLVMKDVIKVAGERPDADQKRNQRDKGSLGLGGVPPGASRN
ncbi:MAG: hypothetical protein NTX31_05530 [Burkholderiales bacterium]|nr:hypothetical protein [Burkholderiales bacterium]